ncbi:MAG: sigma-70 family RNA polymerase sigma factor [Bacteroidota bacterium]|nr:sigma-70 family RNA polymerase sigma factor [Bacteroidota bacterium]
MPESPQLQSTVNHLFRHQAGKVVAVLTHIFGSHNIELAEDVVQDTLLTALEQWKLKGIPNNPDGWLFIVAKNKALNLIKKQRHHILFGDDDTQILLQSGYTIETTFNKLAEEELIKDDQLRMMFACCHLEISEETQITLILKTLCGFSTAEIAKTLLTSEDTISKRLYRTKEFFRQQKVKLEIPSLGEIKNRTDAVLNSIYLIFNEGYNSTNSEELIRKDVIEEAVLLCKLLTQNIHTQLPEVYALMALMCFHSSRSDSRLTSAGDIILLPMQDRNKWNKKLIAKGNEYMNQAAFGNTISTYHIEATIAYEHCHAQSYDKTNWQKILEYYDWLYNISPSQITAMNRVVAILQLHGADVALKELEAISDKEKLETYYLYYSLLGEIHSQLYNRNTAQQYFEKAIGLTQSEAEKKMLQHKIAALLN